MANGVRRGDEGMTWLVSGPEFDGRKIIVEDELTEQEAVEAADLRNSAAARVGVAGGYTALPQGVLRLKRGSVVRRMVAFVSAVVALIGLSVLIGGAAWSAAGSSSTAVITFDDAAQQTQLIIPTPACPASQPACQWKFFLNEPKLSVDVATVYGTSGTLTIDYPKDFCGVIQADAYVGPPWVAKRGFQHTIENCTPPTTTTTAAPATTTTTEPPTPPTTSTTTATPSVVSASESPPPTEPSAQPPTASPVATSASAPISATPAQLPFTGVNVKPLWFIGSTLVAIGLCLLTTAASWRRMARRLLATVQGH